MRPKRSAPRKPLSGCLMIDCSIEANFLSLGGDHHAEVWSRITELQPQHLGLGTPIPVVALVLYKMLFQKRALFFPKIKLFKVACSFCKYEPDNGMGSVRKW